MTNILQRLGEVDLSVTLYFNRINHLRLISRFFAIVSRMGNGFFWYMIIASLPFIYGWSAIQISSHMLLVGFLALLIYKALKLLTTRQRPYQIDDNIYRNVAALDLYSFPSGHTMHAVSFSTVLTHYYPEWGWLVWSFTFFVALSRLVLGLHYPSDVVVGGVIGFSVAILSFSFSIIS